MVAAGGRAWVGDDIIIRGGGEGCEGRQTSVRRPERDQSSAGMHYNVLQCITKRVWDCAPSPAQIIATILPRVS